ncbi:MAG: preprotein translocase subunit Sec61beta [Candidatus Pacearchaeota archaeon]
MAKDNSISMPGVFGGLMRYNEEYDSKFKISPEQVIIFVILLLLMALGLKIFFPIS